MRTVAETETVGDEIISEMGRNREAIESSTIKAKETGAMIDSAGKTIKAMHRRHWSLGFL